MIAGVDEAGRGPVLGPMVMAIVACDEEDTLRKKGFKDSKLLSPEKREKLAKLLREDEKIKHETIALSPAEIDAAVQGNGDNLNKLEARTTALLIYRLAKRTKVETVILDSPTRTVASYERMVREALDKIDKEKITKKILLRAEIKADFNHPVVGAASILAKTERDAAIALIEKKHGKIGSGYPADPDTQAFLIEHYKEPYDFFRKSWESYQRLVQAKDQKSLSDFGVERKNAVKEFEQLEEYGFVFQEPTNKYELVRMKSDAGVIIIKYNTGKLLVQGPAKEKKVAENLLKKLKFSTKA